MGKGLILAIATGLAIGVPAAQAEAEFDDVTLRGAWEYHEACSVCHGPDGAGGGAMGGVLTVAPPELTTLAERNDGVFPFDRVFRVIDGRLPVEGHGSPDMPVWGRTFRGEAYGTGGPGLFREDPSLIAAGRIYALARYLRAIQGGKKVPLVEPSRPLRHFPSDIPVWPRKQ